MIVWGGDRTGWTNVGAAYDPATDTWEVVNRTGAPSPRGRHSAVWTGSEMIIWGGQTQSGAMLSDGAAYDPRTAKWRPISACAAKSEHSAIWTGSEMVVWGGNRNTGHRYEVATNSWRQLEVLNSPAAVSGHSAVWTGSEMIVWFAGRGTRYQP
jgi:N-acetylneuraminic acid mutarotase